MALRCGIGGSVSDVMPVAAQLLDLARRLEYATSDYERQNIAEAIRLAALRLRGIALIVP